MDVEWSVVISERRDLVERELTAAAGGESLCSISRSAGPVPGVKYLEGRMAALGELERAQRRGEDPDSVRAEAHARWRERLSGAQQRAMGTDWTAYYAGGVDELAEISPSERSAVSAGGATRVGAGRAPMIDPCDEGGDAPCWAHLFPEPEIADSGSGDAPSRPQPPS